MAVAFKLIESAQHTWRAMNAPRLVALVRAGFEKSEPVEGPPKREETSKSRDTPVHKS